MKAVIMEMHKDYCIVMTPDGQFLKRRIPAGVFEIGDEIVIEQEYSLERAKPVRTGWVRKFAITISVAALILSIALIFGVRYMRNYLGTSWFGGYEMEELVVVGDEKKEEVAEERVFGEAEAAEAEPEEMVIYENIYTIEEYIEFEEFIDGIMFSYNVAGTNNLNIRLENIDSAPYFNGSFKITMLRYDGSESQTKDILLQGFKPGQVRESKILIRNEETGFKLQVIKIIY